ncbi:MAG: ABC transporter permease [Vicinamibacteria bacterium]|nr:ABC transporter permease [Vicinamibacteria bacterium]
MDALRQDLKFALRSLGKARGFAAVVVLTLALGIGANTAIFNLLDQLLLRPLPVRAPQELVLVRDPGPFMGRTYGDDMMSHPLYRELREKNEVFSGMLARHETTASVGRGDATEMARVELVSGNYFEVLGLAPVLGRLFTLADDETPGTHPVVVLGHGYWRRRFGADPAVVGATVRVNGQPMTALGVAPAGFGGLSVGAAADVFVPLAMKALVTPTWDGLDDRRTRFVNVFARLKPGLAAERAQAGLDVLSAAIVAEDVKLYPDAPERFRTRFLAKRFQLRPGAQGLSGLRAQFGTPLLVLMGMVALVLLIACANVANLLLARGAARGREVAIRLALGAGRRHLARQLLVESALLAAAGGALGLVLAGWTGEALLAALPGEQAARALVATPDARVVGFALGLSLLTGLLFGLMPAWQATRPDLAATLKQETGAVVGGGSVRLRKVLVAAQVALSLTLVAGAALFVRSLTNVIAQDPGYRTEGVIAFNVDPTLGGHQGLRAIQFFRTLREALLAEPGVSAVSASSSGLLTGNEWFSTVRVDGYVPKEGENMNPRLDAIGPAFFATLGQPLLAGREFDDRDGWAAPRVAVVDESFARYFFGGESPIGRRFGFGGGDPTSIEIVGLVRDARAVDLRGEPSRTVYIPDAQLGFREPELGEMVVYVRAADPALAASRARDTVRRLDPNLPVYQLKTLEAQLGESVFTERMVAALAAAFGALATLLAGLGLYGVMSYVVARRTREIGVRIAVGASGGQVARLVLREVALLASLGVAVGLPATVALAHAARSQLFGLSPGDPATLAAAGVGLFAIALLAGAVPARRASAVDPIQALRND